jgi:hypothetical protein
VGGLRVSVLVCVGVAPDGILLCEKHGHSEGEGNYQAKGGLYLRHAFRSARNLSAAMPDILGEVDLDLEEGNRQVIARF